MIAIFNAEVERQFQADVAERTGLHGPDAQRRYDALQAIFRKAVTAPADGRFPTSLVSCTFAQVDHMIEWSDDGTTDPENSSIGCNRHNPTKHNHYKVNTTGPSASGELGRLT